jgi:hypothetical protein
MTADIAGQPLAQAVLRHLATTRSEDDPLGSLARTVISGEADLRTAATNPPYGQALASAFQESQDAYARMSPEQRHEYSQQAQRLSSHAPAGDGDA